MNLLDVKTMLVLETEKDTYYFRRVVTGGLSKCNGKWDKDISFVSFNDICENDLHTALTCELPKDMYSNSYTISIYEKINVNVLEKIEVEVGRYSSCQECNTAYLNDKSNFCHKCGTKREYYKTITY